VITLGDRGCLVVTRESVEHIPALRVKAVDTTAAGDAFTGALAAGLSSGSSLLEAAGYASAVAALSVTRMGAQSSLPNAIEVAEFLRELQV
jgi:ribokinase